MHLIRCFEFRFASSQSIHREGESSNPTGDKSFIQFTRLQRWHASQRAADARQQQKRYKSLHRIYEMNFLFVR